MLRHNRFRIKLPGTEKHKKVLLIILIIIAIVVISYDALGNRSSKNSENNKQKQEETIKADDMSKTNITNTTNNSNMDESTKTSDNTGKEEESMYSDKENQLYNDAYTSFFSHDYNNAIIKANLIVNEFPNNAIGYNIRGIAKAYNGDYDGGMNDIDKALSIDDHYGYARFNKALTYELYEKFDKALECYNKDLEVEEYVWSYYGIASIYGRKGDVKNTMTYLNKAVQLDAGVKETAKTEHDFDPVKNSQEFQGVIYN